MMSADSTQDVVDECPVKTEEEDNVSHDDDGGQMGKCTLEPTDESSDDDGKAHQEPELRIAQLQLGSERLGYGTDQRTIAPVHDRDQRHHEKNPPGRLPFFLVVGLFRGRHMEASLRRGKATY